MGLNPALENRRSAPPLTGFARDAQMRAERERQAWVERDRAAQAPILAMKADRDMILKLMGELQTAAKTLLEGKVSTAEMISHEFGRLMQKVERAIEEEAAFSGIGLPMSFYTSDLTIAPLAIPSGTSVQKWSEAIDEIIIEAAKLPNAIGALGDTFKIELAAVIKKGQQLTGGNSSVADDAGAHVAAAARIYGKLSGTSYL